MAILFISFPWNELKNRRKNSYVETDDIIPAHLIELVTQFL